MQNIVLAGATGGIGRAIAKRLLKAPDTAVWGLCRAPEDEQDWIDEYQGRLRLGRWDGSCPGQFKERIASLLPADAQVDGLIFASGLLHGEGVKPEKRLEDVDASNLEHAFTINAMAFPLLVQALLPWLRHKEPKRLMAISAKVGSLTDNRMGGWYAYRASKAALNMFVRNLAIELPRRTRGMCCVAVHPGTTRTPLSAPYEQSLAQLVVHDADETADNMVTVFEKLTDADNGRFINWDGTDLPW
ncbi:MAG: SDR family NAD(P)-dependent oxidoreductase [Oleiphilaceae bacterium]|nr:SDR family NAD(P)-dependent oxidoreductase [Oleiphilaceae bacterium]